MFVGHHQPCDVTFRVGDELRNVRVVNYRLSPRARLQEHLAWILCASLLYRAVPWPPLRRWLSRHTPWIAALEGVDFAGDIRGGDGNGAIQECQCVPLRLAVISLQGPTLGTSAETLGLPWRPEV
jgi:hypothetical protein